MGFDIPSVPPSRQTLLLDPSPHPSTSPRLHHMCASNRNPYPFSRLNLCTRARPYGGNTAARLLLQSYMLYPILISRNTQKGLKQDAALPDALGRGGPQLLRTDLRIAIPIFSTTGVLQLASCWSVAAAQLRPFDYFEGWGHWTTCTCQ